MPESILGALFLITKQYRRALLAQQESRWSKYVSDTLYRKTLGILGLGAIGQELARKAAALEMRVIGTRRSPATVPHVETIYGPEDTDQMLQQADFVVVLLPSTPVTDNFMNAARLRAMKPTAWLLNFARGAAVVDEDLLAAVKSKQIAGAILDSFREEPLPATHPFWKTDGIVVLPHVGGASAHRGAVVADIFAENAGHFLAGRPLRNEINRERGY
jgi:phosphoglycerate dehydrogenase-like enzyme